MITGIRREGEVHDAVKLVRDFPDYSFSREVPPAEHFLRVGVRRGKFTFHADPGIDLAGKAGELRPVHLAADILPLPPPQPGFLRRAGGHLDDHFIFLLDDGVTDDHRPREMAQCPHKPGEAFLGDPEPADDILRRHTGDPAPDLLIDLLSNRLPVLVADIDEPERVHHAIVPEKELEILVFVCVIHLVKDLEVHATHSGSPGSTGTPFSMILICIFGNRGCGKKIRKEPDYQ